MSQKLFENLFNKLFIGFNIYLLVAFALLAIGSLKWFLIHDTPLMLYVGFAVDQFDLAPYRDIFDMNPPGSYVLYGLMAKIAGSSNMAMRIIDVATLLGFLSIIVGFAKTNQGWKWAITSATLFGITILNAGAEQTLQREFLGLLFISVTVISLYRSLRFQLHAAEYYSVGFLSGFYVMIKPPFLLYFCLSIVFLTLSSFYIHSSSVRDILKKTSYCAAGLLSFPVLAIVYFWKIDCLTDFVEMVTNYWPLYATLNGMGQIHQGGDDLQYYTFLCKRVLKYAKHAPMFIPLPVGLFFGLLLIRKMNIKERIEFGFLIATTAIGIVYLLISPKLWVYHYFPLYFSLCLWSGYSLYLVWDVLKLKWLRHILSLAVMAVILSQISMKKNYAACASFFKSGFAVGAPGVRVRPIVKHFKAHLKPGDKVQPLDVAKGVAHAMLISKVEISTSFLYDFNFYHHIETPYIQSLRQKFLLELKQGEAKIIVDNQRCYWMKHINKEQSFSELYEWMSDNYSLVQKSKCYDFWHKND